MIEFDIVKSIIEIYPEKIIFNVNIINERPNLHYEYYFDFTEPSVLNIVKQNIMFSECIVELMQNVNMDVFITVKSFTYDMNGIKVYIDESVKSVKLFKEWTYESSRKFDIKPYPVEYDRGFMVANNLLMKPLTGEIWIPPDINNTLHHEMPNYVPFICQVYGGVPPYTYEWKIDNTVKEYDYMAYVEDDICSFVGLEKGVFHVYCKVTDDASNSVELIKDFYNVPDPILIPYQFDDYKSVPSHYDARKNIAKDYESEYIVPNTINFYFIQYNIEVEFESEYRESEYYEMVNDILVQNVSENMFYWRWASSKLCYKSLSNREKIYRPFNYAIHNVYADKNNKNKMTVHFEITSNYGVSTLAKKIRQALIWAAIMGGYRYNLLDFDALHFTVPLLYYCETVDNMGLDIYDRYYKSYKDIELDELYEIVQQDVHKYLADGNKNKYNGNLYVGLTNLG